MMTHQRVSGYSSPTWLASWLLANPLSNDAKTTIRTVASERDFSVQV